MICNHVKHYRLFFIMKLLLTGFLGKVRRDFGLGWVLIECMKPHVGVAIQHCNLVIANDILLDDAVVIVVRKRGKFFTEHGVSIATVKIMLQAVRYVPDYNILSIAFRLTDKPTLQAHTNACVTLIIIISPLSGPFEKRQGLLRQIRQISLCIIIPQFVVQ